MAPAPASTARATSSRSVSREPTSVASPDRSQRVRRQPDRRLASPRFHSGRLQLDHRDNYTASDNYTGAVVSRHGAATVEPGRACARREAGRAAARRPRRSQHGRGGRRVRRTGGDTAQDRSRPRSRRRRSSPSSLSPPRLRSMSPAWPVPASPPMRPAHQAPRPDRPQRPNRPPLCYRSAETAAVLPVGRDRRCATGRPRPPLCYRSAETADSTVSVPAATSSIAGVRPARSADPGRARSAAHRAPVRPDRRAGPASTSTIVVDQPSAQSVNWPTATPGDPVERTGTGAGG